MDKTATRFVGHCQICEGEFKMDSHHTMVHHGYKRPGWGHIMGDCMAVGQPAYEQSCEFLKEYTEGLKAGMPARWEDLRQHKEGEIKELLGPTRETRYNRNPHMMYYHVGEPGFEELLASRIRDKERHIAAVRAEIARCEKRIAAWKPLPVRTVEELVVEQQQSRAQAKAAREDKRGAKLAAKIAGYQKRIDSAVKRHTTSVIADIFETSPQKIREIAGRDISKVDALKMLQRDHVWAAFGLTVTDEALRYEYGVKNPNSTICSDMRYPEYKHPETKKYPWPAGL